MTYLIHGNPYAAQDRYEELRWQSQYAEDDAEKRLRERSVKLQELFPDNIEDALPAHLKHLVSDEYAQEDYAQMVKTICDRAAQREN